MKKALPILGALIVILVLWWVLAGRNKQSKETPTPTPTPVATSAGPSAKLQFTAKYVGPPVTPKPLLTTPECGAKRTSEEILVKDGKLANVVVRVVDLPVSATFASQEPAIVDQEGCMYRPRVQVVLAGATVTIRNSDKTGHNVHTYAGDETCFNRGQPTPGTFAKKIEDFCGGKETAPILLKCDIHPWMTGYVLVSSNPYSGVTGDDGTAAISLPAGSYTIEAWHEKFGAKREKVEVTADGAVLAIEFGADK